MNTPTPADNVEVPRWSAWGLPLIFSIAVALWCLVSPDTVRTWLGGELGVIENLEATALAAALFFGVLALASREIRAERGKTAWVGLFVLGMVYALGEEISWGQHYFGWATPEWYRGINDQEETNLHNNSSWLDQKPRALIELGIYFSMLIYPRWRWHSTRGLFARVPDWAWPTRIGLPTALLILLAQIVDLTPVARWTSHIGLRLSEVREFLMYFFLYVYIHSFYRRRAALPG